ncbi:MAG: [FeFe] hydrogenase H-cluster maturation GTPase HydF [Syntrophomonadaceae bacterium]|nr:[FeFe] hydrogenase H-cluster maturation GTPase HydF [Syntrophomonadaceae bacterium]
MHATPQANRPHITIFGRRNTGKSSLINVISGQDIALVSATAGTTTDPVYKSMEILPLGPCVLIDTAGIDDDGTLGSLRVKKTREVLDKTDLALLLFDPFQPISSFEMDLIKDFKQREIPFIGIINKIDIGEVNKASLEKKLNLSLHSVSCTTGQGIKELIELIVQQTPSDYQKDTIVGDLLSPGDLCLLVTPIDKAAPRGRLILPQVQTIRDILDHHSMTMVVREAELSQALTSLAQTPRIVICDSQVFKEVASQVSESIPLTSFSILFARYKGDLPGMVNDLKAVERLQPGDRVLIAEACTHHRQDDDIATVKIPHLLQKKIGGDLDLNWCRGSSYPDNLDTFKLIIHCGACMLNRRQMMNRIKMAHETGIPIINYGLFLAYVNGILDRSIQPLMPKSLPEV